MRSYARPGCPLKDSSAFWYSVSAESFDSTSSIAASEEYEASVRKNGVWGAIDETKTPAGPAPARWSAAT